MSPTNVRKALLLLQRHGLQNARTGISPPAPPNRAVSGCLYQNKYKDQLIPIFFPISVCHFPLLHLHHHQTSAYSSLNRIKPK